MNKKNQNQLKKVSQQMPMLPFDSNSSCAWQRMQPQVARMRELYGNAKQFLETFTPELQSYAAREWVRAYTGAAPALETVAAGYGRQTAEVWICMELENLNLFAGVKEKMSVARQKELAGIILVEYAHLKVSELLLFFHRLKCGRYGRFYGSVDALFITSALLQFMTERHADLARIANQREEAQKANNTASTGITYQEYLSRKAEREKRMEQLKTNQDGKENSV